MLERIMEYIAEHGLASKNDRILVGLSGGMDSVCLLRSLRLLGFNVGAAHVNYGLRGDESDGDEEFCRKLCETLQVPFFVYHVQNEFGLQKGSVQMVARDIRYGFFSRTAERKKYDCIAVATHAGDNVETFFLNALRGTGLSGLAGIRPHRDNVIRPLLFAFRGEIQQFVNAQKWDFRHDSSNDQLKYKRNNVRQLVIPALEKVVPDAAGRIQSTMGQLSGQEALLQALINEWKEEHVLQADGTLQISMTGLKNLPKPSLMLFMLLKEYGFNHAQCADLMGAAQSGAIVESHGYTAFRDRMSIMVGIRKGPGQEETLVEFGTRAILGPMHILFEEMQAVPTNFSRNQEDACFDLGKLQFPLRIRKWRPGDRFRPFGMKGFKKVSDFLVDEKVPLAWKDQVYVMESGDQICWVIGHRMDDRFRVSGHTRRALAAKIVS